MHAYGREIRRKRDSNARFTEGCGGVGGGKACNFDAVESGKGEVIQVLSQGSSGKLVNFIFLGSYMTI